MARVEFPLKAPNPRSSEELLNSSSISRTTVVIVVHSAHIQFLVGGSWSSFVAFFGIDFCKPLSGAVASISRPARAGSKDDLVGARFRGLWQL